MALYYFDTSALVKYYVTEPGSTWVMGLIDARDPDTGLPMHTVFLAGASVAEVSAALSILHRRGIISRRQRDDAYDHFLADLEERFAIVAMPLQDFYSAAELAQRHPLKAYDVVQLAVALRHSQALAAHDLALTFVSGDDTLLTAAQSEGLPTDNPFDHVSPHDIPQQPPRTDNK
jgi:predicted nucleic acid-binding protein